MFKNLFNFAYKRTPKEAIGFYLAYFLAFIVFGGLIGGIAGGFGSIFVKMSFDEGFELGKKIGQFIGPVACLIVSFWILKEKRLYRSFIYPAIALSSVLLAFFSGALGGLIPIAYLTTRDAVQDPLSGINVSGEDGAAPEKKAEETDST